MLTKNAAQLSVSPGGCPAVHEAVNNWVVHPLLNAGIRWAAWITSDRFKKPNGSRSVSGMNLIFRSWAAFGSNWYPGTSPNHQTHRTSMCCTEWFIADGSRWRVLRWNTLSTQVYQYGWALGSSSSDNTMMSEWVCRFTVSWSRWMLYVVKLILSTWDE